MRTRPAGPAFTSVFMDQRRYSTKLASGAQAMVVG
jgi:hypothetical protein